MIKKLFKMTNGALRFRFRKSLILLLLLLLLLIIIFTAIISYRKLNVAMTESAYSKREAIAKISAVTLKERLDRLSDLGVSIASRITFRKLIVEGRWIDAVEVIKEIPKVFPMIERVAVLDTRGILMADTPSDLSIRGKSFAFREWYQGVSQNWQPYVSGVFLVAAAPKHNVIAVAIPVKGDGKNVDAILFLQVNVEKIYNWAKEIKIGTSGFVYFVDRNGNLVGHPHLLPQDKIVNYSQNPIVKKVLQGKSGIEIATGANENDVQLSAYEPVPGHAWGVIVQQLEVEAFSMRNSGLKLLLLAYSIILLVSSILVIIILRVISRSEKVKIELVNIRAAKETAEEIAKKKTQFLDIAAHELRTPITSLSLLLQTTTKQIESGKPINIDLLARLRRPVDRLTKLVIDLLDISRLERGLVVIQLDKTDIGSLISKCLEDFHALSPERKFIFHQPNGLIEVKLDPVRINQVLSNLLDNAIKYTNDGPIEVTLVEMPSKIMISVIDHGPGISKSQRESLFTPFSRGSSDATINTSGLGLGLSVCYGIIKLHQGVIGVECTEGSGCTFYFELPKRNI